MTIPGTRGLRSFDAAARHMNFTRAAAEIGVTPAAISHQIKEFEDQLGLELFTRTSRAMRRSSRQHLRRRAGDVPPKAVAA